MSAFGNTRLWDRLTDEQRVGALLALRRLWSWPRVNGVVRAQLEEDITHLTALCGAAPERESDRGELIAAAKAVLEHIDESQGSQAGSEETGSDFFDGATGTDARRALEAAVQKAVGT